MKLNILYEDNHIIVVVKPVYVLSQSDGSDTLDMLTLLKEYLRRKYHKPGNVYLGLVHRLDKEVGGVMVFAKTSKAAKRLSFQIQKHQFEKWYFAMVHGQLLCDGIMEDYLVRDHYRSFVGSQKNGKLAKLSYHVLDSNQQYSLVQIQLETGRHHQIRIQFASRGFALFGDKKYGKKEKEALALYAYHLSFFHPITKEKLVFENFPSDGFFKDMKERILCFTQKKE